MTSVKPKIRAERVYDDPEGTTGGFRVFVDRLWPRGESKALFHYDLWAKDLTPSTELRRWFHEDRNGRWEEFGRRFEAELKANPAVNGVLDILRQHSDIVLLSAVRDLSHSHVVILTKFLSEKL